MSDKKSIYITDRDDQGVLLGHLVGVSGDDPLYEVRLAPELVVLSHDGQSRFDGADNQEGLMNTEISMTTEISSLEDPHEAVYLEMAQDKARADLRLQALTAAGEAGTPEARIARARQILAFLTEEDEEQE